jgi:hypothetical protein
MASQCRRCERLVDFLHTVPVSVPARESGWYLLCADCYRAVLGREPPAESAVREWAKRRGRR